MKPGRGIFCPFRVNPRIFSGPPTRLTLPPCPSALLPSLFALPALSSPATFDPSAHVHLLRSFHLLPSPHAFSMSLSPFLVLFSHIRSILPIIFLHISFLTLSPFLRRETLSITDNTITMSLHNFTPKFENRII